MQTSHSKGIKGQNDTIEGFSRFGWQPVMVLGKKGPEEAGLLDFNLGKVIF